MERLNRRIPAFTVIETMVALVLTALVISFIFTAMRWVNRQSGTLTAQLAASGEMDRLYHALQTDTDRSSEIRRFPDGLVFRRADTSVYYLNVDSLCIRRIGHLTDTFRVQIDSLAYWFLNSRQETPRGVVDACSMYVTRNNRATPVFIRKTYDMAALMYLTDSTTTP
ncbi:PulJ/GspJ family protein [Parapedobacter sp. 10938]|uniref:PulJ/GspJ family protein n=1 Tax=Parapedobacter flavus TaxID=3110225 RepID=UPI002DBCA515|nr:hypothetical protein [Parapedobacter sp. 10938]MEC3878630.1 hypothetical protein [Parapedobacter sp. 10938]